MNFRDHFVGTLQFNSAAAIPLIPGNGRKSTLERWHREGLPAGVDGSGTTEEACRQAGIPVEKLPDGPGFPINFNMNPMFEEKVIEVREHSQVVQDWKGNVCEIGREFTTEYLRHAIDFVTRRWIRCPVESRADWPDMRRRYQSCDPGRFPADPAAQGKRIQNRDYPLILSFSGPYWILREWCGFEGLSMLFYDDPALVEEMIEFWERYVLEIMEKAFAVYTPEMVHFSEDMAYKGHSMLSPEMCRKFLLPTWKRWGECAKAHGVPLFAVDSDGYIGELIPLWIEAGVDACDPVEVAAGNDIVRFRREYGRDMAYRGGVDKREMARGGRHIEAEIERLKPVIRSGGFIPGCDHGVPSDVSWPDFVHYVRCLHQAIRG